MRIIKNIIKEIKKVIFCNKYKIELVKEANFNEQEVMDNLAANLIAIRQLLDEPNDRADLLILEREIIEVSAKLLGYEKFYFDLMKDQVKWMLYYKITSKMIDVTYNIIEEKRKAIL